MRPGQKGGWWENGGAVVLEEPVQQMCPFFSFWRLPLKSTSKMALGDTTQTQAGLFTDRFEAAGLVGQQRGMDLKRMPCPC